MTRMQSDPDRYSMRRPAIAAILAAGVFLLDTLAPADIAVAVLLFGGRAAVDRLPLAARNFADGRSLRVSHNIELFAQSWRIVRWRGTGRLFDESGRHWANNGSGDSHSSRF